MLRAEGKAQRRAMRSVRQCAYGLRPAQEGSTDLVCTNQEWLA